MAAGLGFKTFTTGEVLTATDTNGYLMQGVLVFASAAARDAAITSPQEGQFAYLKDTDVTTFYTGSAWAVSGNTALVLVKSQVIGTGVSSVAVTSAFSSAYDCYKIVIGGTGVGSTVGEQLQLQMGSTTTNYDVSSYQIDFSGSAVFAQGTSGGSNWTRVGAIKTTYQQMNLDLTNPFNAAYTLVQGFYDYYTGGGWSTGILRNTTSYTGFTIIPAGGTMTGGTIYVYGYKNS
jgi:hypothetical protein